MDAIREEEVLDDVMKKSKKRKKRESDAQGGEGNVQLGDEGHKKKMKTEVLGDNSASEECRLGSNSDVDNRSEKEKKKKDKKRIDIKDQGNDDGRGREKKKSKIGDGGAKNVLAAPDKMHLVSENWKDSEPQTRKKEKIRKFDGNSIESKAKNSVMKSGVVVANDVEPVKEGDERLVKKKKNKKIMELKGNEGDFASGNDSDGHACFVENEIDNIEKVQLIENNKKKKKKKRKEEDNLGACLSDKEVLNDSHGRRKDSQRIKEKSIGSKTKGVSNEVSEIIDRIEASERSEKSNVDKKSKKVSFSGHVEVFNLPDDLSKGKKKLKDDSNDKESVEDGLIRGKRFSKEEDEIVKNAVLKYIDDHQLGEGGLDMVLKCKSHSEIRDCWKEIGEALPYRPYTSVYYRAHILFERSESRKWSPEELELVKEFHEKHGADWRTLADELSKHRIHVKDAWRRIKLANRKKGHWSQEEYQNLFTLVNIDLSMKAFEEKKSQHGMLRDNIAWEAISDKLMTRTNALCCQKWYDQLTSPMVAEGKWADADDYRLLMALVEIDAACEEDVDWDNLIDHRSGDVCRKRWNQMVRHIGEHGIKSFSEQVEVLSQRYRLDLLEAREAYDSQSPVD